MSAFTELERAALRAIFSETPELLTDLERQMECATVMERRNSGVGFFTDIAVPDDAPRVRSPNVLGHNTHARVRGLEYGLCFVLFMSHGKLDMLEGFVWGDESTVSLDLTSLIFEVFDGPIDTLH